MASIQVNTLTNASVNDQSPFLLENSTAYETWRKLKLHNYPGSANELIVDIDSIANVSGHQKQLLLALCQKTNMVVYRCQTPTVEKQDLRKFCEGLGLLHLDHNLCADDDGISALHVVPKGTRQEYIPYSNHAINWHTDGYYNDSDKKIKGMVLHCVRPALEGGENALLDPEIVYMLIRDTNPDYIAALMQQDAMSIPPNVQDGKEIRPTQTGPVFSVDPLSGTLHMRYTARTRSIHWKNDELTQKAVQCLEEVLRTATPYIFQLRLNTGEGVVSNNVLHTRTAFNDSDEPQKQRLVYRARYYDRITNTGVLS